MVAAMKKGQRKNTNKSPLTEVTMHFNRFTARWQCNYDATEQTMRSFSHVALDPVIVSYYLVVMHRAMSDDCLCNFFSDESRQHESNRIRACVCGLAVLFCVRQSVDDFSFKFVRRQ